MDGRWKKRYKSSKDYPKKPNDIVDIKNFKLIRKLKRVKDYYLDINDTNVDFYIVKGIVEELLDYLGEPMVVGKRYNSIFGLSRKNYQKKLEELNIDSVKKR